MRILTISLISSAIAALTACGGGGGGIAPSANSPAQSLTFQAVATEGELISYTVDTSALTYSYRIVESAYGKTDATGSGQLTRNADGTYTPSGFNGKIALLGSGLLLGAIYEDLNNDLTREIVPIIGVSNPVTSAQEAAGIYNFISRQCGASCDNYYGTVKVNTDGTWTSCVGGNLASANYNCSSSVSGAATNFSSGRATLTANGIAGGSMLLFKDPATSQKVILLDLNGKSVLGKGAVFGSSQGLPVSADGSWTYLHTNGTNGVVTVSGNTFSDSGRNANGSSYGPLTGSFTRDEPWVGFIRTSNGSVILPAGTGLYAGFDPSMDSLSVGLKK